MTGQTLALALIVVLLVGWILGFVSCMGIDWWARRQAAARHQAWMRRQR